MCSWLFAAFSYYLSRETGADWFARSGSVMALIGAAATFRLTAGFRKQLATGLKTELASVRQEIELTLNPPPSYSVTSYFGYGTVSLLAGIDTGCLPRPSFHPGQRSRAVALEERNDDELGVIGGLGSEEPDHRHRRTATYR